MQTVDAGSGFGPRCITGNSLKPLNSKYGKVALGWVITHPMDFIMALFAAFPSII